MSHGCAKAPHIESQPMDTRNMLLLDLDSESEEEDLAILHLLSKKRKRRRQNNYLRERSARGEFKLSEEISDTVFRKTFRVNKDQFAEIHELIKEDVTGGECNAQKGIRSEEKLSVCLRYLATGDMFKTIGLSYRMGERTVSKIVSQVCTAIWSHLQPIYMPSPTVEMWENIALDFERKWQVYNCLGSIDGKHVYIRKPILSGSSFYNYKQYCSIVLMATVDAHYRFTTVDIGSMGRFSDGNIFAESSLGKKLRNGSLQFPVPKTLPGQNEVTPYVFIGDEAFPLLPYLMRPYPKVKVTDNFENKVYNYRLSRGRQTVECAFGILAARFRVYKRPFECKLETIDNTVKATTVLHNYLRTKVLSGAIPSDEDNEQITTPSINNFASLPQNRNRSSREAFQIRERFKNCFNSPQGTVEWQTGAVERGKY